MDDFAVGIGCGGKDQTAEKNDRNDKNQPFHNLPPFCGEKLQF
jgi:hypothetical protein